MAVSYEATSTYYATDPDISGIYPRNYKRYTFSQKTCTELLIADLLAIAKTCKQPRVSSAGECLNKTVHLPQGNTTQQMTGIIDDMNNLDIPVRIMSIF